MNGTQDDWKWLADTPEEFCEAIKNAKTPKEKEFFEKLMYKILNETAGSNDVLMHDRDNEDGLYILRVGTDDIMIGRKADDPDIPPYPHEYAGLFFALEFDLEPYLHRHVTLLEWLRERDYAGIRYDRNNDYL